jgi:pimeloyl-ACP methyl ester carboxylesterase
VLLHHERIARGEPERWCVMTHGIYGAGSNWRGIARKLVERRPEWGVVLVDLRQHGRSGPGEAPHTIAACAEDVRETVAAIGHVRALAGHSFGGKVMLAAHRSVRVQTWVLDATPSANPAEMSDSASSVLRVLSLMERLPKTWTRRDDFVAAVIADGHAQPLAQWLAMNVVPDASGQLALRLDLAALRTMLADYYATDVWDALDSDVHVVIATRSGTIPPADRDRLARSAAHLHAVDADHWLHIEAPAAVIELFAAHLP